MVAENGRGSSRSEFLKQAAGATIVVAGAGIGAGALAEPASAAFTAGRFQCELDGVDVGRLSAASGGLLGQDVLLDAIGPDNIQHKHIGGVKYEEISMRVGARMGKGLYDWIQDSFDKKYTRKDGAITTADYTYKAQSRRAFTEALISEVTFPALDTAAKGGADLVVKLAPTSTSDSKPTGSISGPVQKQWLPANFRLDIQGLDCTRVAKVDSFTWKCSFVVDGSPPVVDISNIVVTFDQDSLASWQQWYDNFVGGGGLSGDPTDERSGTLSVGAGGVSAGGGGSGGALYTVSLSNLGIIELGPETLGSRRVKAEMYCEDISFHMQSSWA